MFVWLAHYETSHCMWYYYVRFIILLDSKRIDERRDFFHFSCHVTTTTTCVSPTRLRMIRFTWKTITWYLFYNFFKCSYGLHFSAVMWTTEWVSIIHQGRDDAAVERCMDAFILLHHHTQNITRKPHSWQVMHVATFVHKICGQHNYHYHWHSSTFFQSEAIIE